MTKRESARMNRNTGTCTCLDKFLSVFSTTDPALKEIYTKMKADSADTVLSAIAASANNTGYSADKIIAKNEVSLIASTLCSAAQVKLDLLKNNTLSKSLNSSQSYYSAASDAVAEVRLLNVYDIMNNNATLITTNFVSPADLTNFLNKINTYTTISGTSMNINKSSPVLTAKFKSDLKLTSEDIVSIKKLMLKYKKSNPTFYYTVIASCMIPVVAVSHTPLIITITNSMDGSAISDVKGGLTNSTMTPISNSKGIMSYETTAGGDKVATFSHPKFLPKSVDIHIISGESNTLSITMNPIPIVEI
jgi:hypothetical protein